ncbi:MAG: response regulator [Proteobacteria bacterium]|nr:MAG: response regulator [Pseudomonadota bacterium]
MPADEPSAGEKSDIIRFGNKIDDRRQLKILVADDIEDNRTLIQLYLKHLPYRLDFARDGEEVIDSWRSRGPFDLILMDMHMPKVDGYQAVSKIREVERTEHLERTMIVALTASALKEDADRSVQAGCDRHLTKPITRESLQRAISDTVTEPTRAERGVGGPRPRVYIKRELEPLMANFIENRRSELDRLDQAVQAHDLSDIIRITHSIKGVAGTFGFARISELAQLVHDSAAEADMIKVRQSHANLREHWDRVEIVYS